MPTLTAVAAPPPGDWTRELPVWAISALDRFVSVPRNWRAKYVRFERYGPDDGMVFFPDPTAEALGGYGVHVVKA